MSAQLTLDLSERKTRRKTGPRLAARMIAILAVRREWTTRSTLKHYGLTDRECRLGREWSHGRVIAGQRGYKLLRYATADEVREAYGAIIAQIAAQQEQARILMRRAHRALAEKNVA